MEELLIAAFNGCLVTSDGHDLWSYYGGSSQANKDPRFLLDMMLIIPMSLSTLVIYNHAGSSLTQRFRRHSFTLPLRLGIMRNAEPLLRGFYEQTMVAGDSVLT